MTDIDSLAIDGGLGDVLILSRCLKAWPTPLDYYIPKRYISLIRCLDLPDHITVHDIRLIRNPVERDKRCKRLQDATQFIVNHDDGTFKDMDYFNVALDTLGLSLDSPLAVLDTRKLASTISDDDYNWLGLAGFNCLAIAPGASLSNRRMDHNNVLNIIRAAIGAERIYICGGLGDSIGTNSRITCLCAASLELQALYLESVGLFICTDSGFLHLANALPNPPKTVCFSTVMPKHAIASRYDNTLVLSPDAIPEKLIGRPNAIHKDTYKYTRKILADTPDTTVMPDCAEVLQILANQGNCPEYLKFTALDGSDCLRVQVDSNFPWAHSVKLVARGIEVVLAPESPNPEVPIIRTIGNDQYSIQMPALFGDKLIFCHIKTVDDLIRTIREIVSSK